MTRDQELARVKGAVRARMGHRAQLIDEARGTPTPSTEAAVLADIDRFLDKMSRAWVAHPVIPPALLERVLHLLNLLASETAWEMIGHGAPVYSLEQDLTAPRIYETRLRHNGTRRQYPWTFYARMRDGMERVAAHPRMIGRF